MRFLGEALVSVREYQLAQTPSARPLSERQHVYVCHGACVYRRAWCQCVGENMNINSFDKMVAFGCWEP